MTPQQTYYLALAEQGFSADPQQAEVIEQLQALYERLIMKLTRSWFQVRRRQFIKGLYLWGSVGAGKTWLMDIFYQAIPGERKLRLHFHRFMQEIHANLQTLAGQANPLIIIAKDYGKRYDVICFDEFVVNNITDAMLLGGLLQALFERGIIFVATSNVHPDHLYHNGLQRERFLPAIAVLKQHTNITQLISQNDYRLRVLDQAGVYYYPLNTLANRQMQLRFEQLTSGISSKEALLIAGRTIPVLANATDVVWFSFDILCHVPRSQQDYLTIAQMYHTVLLSNVAQIPAERDDLICYLIQLVDVFYDANVKLIMSAAVPIAELYIDGRYSFAFQRTRSRLIEMQSHEYLSRAHKV